MGEINSLEWRILELIGRTKGEMRITGSVKDHYLRGYVQGLYKALEIINNDGNK